MGQCPSRNSSNIKNIRKRNKLQKQVHFEEESAPKFNDLKTALEYLERLSEENQERIRRNSVGATSRTLNERSSDSKVETRPTEVIFINNEPTTIQMGVPVASPSPSASGPALASIVSVVPHMRSVLPYGSIPHTLECAIELSTNPTATTSKSKASKKRPPLNLALVLDKSGSMEGASIRDSKTAMQEVVMAMEDRDILHLVAYDDKVEVVFCNGTVEQKRKLCNQIEKIATGGSTDMGIGLMKAFELLLLPERGTEHFPEAHSYQKRIMLFSDGEVNQGLGKYGSTSELFDLTRKMHALEGVITSTCGLGENHDGDLMRGIAESGRSQYVFISQPSEVPIKVRVLLSVLHSTVARGIMLQVHGINSGTVTKLWGFDEHQQWGPLVDVSAEENASSSSTLVGEQLVAKRVRQIGRQGLLLGDMTSNDTQNVMLSVAINAQQQPSGFDSTTEQPGLTPPSYPVLAYTMTYFDDEQEKITVQGTVDVRFSALASAISEDPAEVEVMRVVQVCAMQDNRCAELVLMNQVQQAVELKESSIKALTRVADLDKRKVVGKLIDRATITLQAMQQRKSAREMQANLRYDNYCSKSLCEAGLV